MRLEDLKGQPLTWVQPALLKPDYELRSGDERIGTLNFRNSFGSLARAEIDSGCWSFKRRGFLQTSVTIRACDTEADIALFKNNSWSSGGTLVLPDGREIRASLNFWQSRYAFTDAADQPLIQYKTSLGLRMSGQMDILPAADTLRRELPWLVMLGWYFAVMMQRDSASV